MVLFLSDVLYSQVFRKGLKVTSAGILEILTLKQPVKKYHNKTMLVSISRFFN